MILPLHLFLQDRRFIFEYCCFQAQLINSFPRSHCFKLRRKLKTCNMKVFSTVAVGWCTVWDLSREQGAVLDFMCYFTRQMFCAIVSGSVSPIKTINVILHSLWMPANAKQEDKNM